ncbi:MAG: hypothetical protein GT589_06790 [Peptoclostridium sp.]|uniref:UPF0489 family protein n=1 Tax=Peptoclostridium sp. TaxID=1904860 RepID=UPI00139E704E|nr:UPF0489 family protein [Peptoclostridium sp.]MZQ75852.1 hypothetical protein [Peptoclostridium sp.]
MERYRGFYIDVPLGNNAFSYDERSQKSIYVAPLEKGGLESLSCLAVSSKVAFCELDEGKERCCYGLKSFLELEVSGKRVYIFDNHNHAFYFWSKAIREGLFSKGALLVHVDQHKDMREPEEYIGSLENEAEVFRYTNYVLNVGNFIKPALRLDMFKDVFIIDSSSAFREDIDEDIVLDIDMDIFSDDMAYISFDMRLERIRELYSQASVVTIATSPYFIDQARAIELIKRIIE